MTTVFDYINGADEIARFDFTRPNNKTSNRINLCAEWLWEKGYGFHGNDNNPVTKFTDLTRNQKLGVVADWLEKSIHEQAKAQIVKRNQLAAVTDATSELGNN